MKIVLNIILIVTRSQTNKSNQWYENVLINGKIKFGL